MNLADFKQKNLQQKTNLIWGQGDFLAIRYSHNCNVCLYSMGKFYAEIWYRLADNEIHAIKSFSCCSHLDSYLALIDLSEINQQNNLLL
ncbi:hypothetical protein [Adhaeribacter pallidiroseus]|uniref:Uncharacterized protein n=1 Tax=Adhaeribacter pallidiroseus TaxID=2072847 RepID=A0A369QQ06_9BACT|nr:hypothetical protein [Adhaeribacter pallidiroseus]RDC66392.1 hypothetical protein AHMF7616_05023 [Adhaeribacter pallidiroseus]